MTISVSPLGAYAYLSGGKKITRQQCAALLFDEFRQLSRMFSVYGPYRHLIEMMITHMQNRNGMPFRDMALDRALKGHILSDNSTDDSTGFLLEEALRDNIDWENKNYPLEDRDELRAAILKGRLPKFDRLQDNFNGMGITVHDTWATHITIKSLHIDNDSFRAVLHYRVQDHFGLDSDDISNVKYSQFGFKPFMTNMEATIEITGVRNETKK